MGFTESTYDRFIAEDGAARSRLVTTYSGADDQFDVVIVGSGVGGGILADDLAERVGADARILVVEAGSFLYPTHVYNICRFPNADVARRFGVRTFHQQGDSTSEFHIGEQPQLNLGGRSIFWSGLIPEIQGWELDYFPAEVRAALTGGLLDRAGDTLNESRSLGDTATKVVTKLRESALAQDFEIVQTARALHQPYLKPDGSPTTEFFTEPTGVFNTAELLIGQLGGARDDAAATGLHLLLNTFVEAVDDQGDHVDVLTRDVRTGETRTFRTGRVVLCGGSIESPKLLQRSPALDTLADDVRPLVGRGLTDHPTSNEITTSVTGIGGVTIPRSSNVKIIFYSRGLRDGGRIRYPFNVEMNINHEWWHLRDDDPTALPPVSAGPCPLDIKFSFANCLDDGNAIRTDQGYVPEIDFRNLSWTSHLTGSRIPVTAGWSSRPDADELWWVLNEVTHRIFSLFDRDGTPARPHGERWFGQGRGFGWGTVHHATGSLRMPTRPHLDADFGPSVVDADLRLRSTGDRRGVYVCDMSVMPLATAANPVRTLAALALRLSAHLADEINP